VVAVYLRLIVVLVTINAAERREIIRNEMAFVAEIPFAPMLSAVNREILRIVIERRVPVRRRMTIGAVMRIAVIMVRQSVVIVRIVTGVAIAGSIRILTAHMALRATNADVGSGQRESRRAVIESRAAPR